MTNTWDWNWSVPIWGKILIRAFHIKIIKKLTQQKLLWVWSLPSFFPPSWKWQYWYKDHSFLIQCFARSSPSESCKSAVSTIKLCEMKIVLEMNEVYKLHAISSYKHQVPNLPEFKDHLETDWIRRN